MDRTFTLFISVSLHPWTQYLPVETAQLIPEELCWDLKKNSLWNPKQSLQATEWTPGASLWGPHRLWLSCLCEEGCELIPGSRQSQNWGQFISASRPPWCISSKLFLWAALCNFPGMIIPQSSCPFCPYLKRTAAVLITSTKAIKSLFNRKKKEKDLPFLVFTTTFSSFSSFLLSHSLAIFVATSLA